MNIVTNRFRTPTVYALEILRDFQFDVTQDFDEPSGGAIKDQIDVTITASMRRTSLEVTFYWIQRAQWIVDMTVSLSGRASRSLSNLSDKPATIRFKNYLQKSRAASPAILEGDKFQYNYAPTLVFPDETEKPFILCRDFIEAALDSFGVFLTIE